MFFSDRWLFCREAGAGAPLLIIPGNTASSACHGGELAHFAARYRAICPDLPGTGQSGRLDTWPKDWWAASAAAIIAFLDQRQIARCAVIGTSGGAAIALLAALAAPTRITAVIADSVVPHFPANQVRAQLVARAEQTPAQQSFWSLAHGADWKQVVAADTAMLAHYATTGVDYFQGRLDQVQCPVLITASLADSVLPAVGAQLCAMVQALPHGQLFLTNTGDHPLMWSRPADFRLVADAFLARFGA
jgi:pimeloyl-ACP methyl ester carboxylesterase